MDIVYADILMESAIVKKTGISTLVMGVCALLAAVVVSGAEAKIVTYGQFPYNVQPSCEPKPKNCTVVGKTTGFMARAGTRRGPYIVDVKKGEIISWGMAMGLPGKWVDFFNDIFGERSRVRLAVLRKSKSNEGGGNRYRLMRQSATVEVTTYYGSSPAFALDDPLPVSEGDVIALTVFTWAPAFRVNLPSSYSWRSDRKRGSCSNVRKGVTHTKQNTTRPYQCLYRTAQLLYYADVKTD